MSSFLAPSLGGIDYQGRFFLAEAARLRMVGGNVRQVGLEHDEVQGFDDVVVYYERPEVDEHYGPVAVDFYQVKFQVRQAAECTWQDLMKPSFINSKTTSLLQRLQRGVAEQAVGGVRARFTLLAPRPVGGDLRRLIRNEGDRLDLDALFRGGDRSKFGKIRRAWRSHLGLDSDDALRPILSPLRIKCAPGSDDMKERLDARLRLAGMYPIDGTQRANRYDDLPRKLIQAGITVLDRDSFDRYLQQEGLITGPPLSLSGPPKRVGIRSFAKHAEGMEEETDAMCCLLEHFEQRAIRDPRLWMDAVLPTVTQFLTEATAGAAAVDLELATHMSVAFAAGWHLDTKAPADIAPIQRREVWRPDRSAPRPAILWREREVEPLGEGPDVALCLSVTHDVRGAVVGYVRQRVPTVGRLVHLVPATGEGQGTVRDGTHAFQLAEAAVKEALDCLPSGDGGRSTVHIFVAAPAALAFFLGQLAHRLGRVMLYEHDFGRASGAEPYAPSLSLG